MSSTHVAAEARNLKDRFGAFNSTPALAANASGSAVVTEVTVFVENTRSQINDSPMTVISCKWFPGAAVAGTANGPTLTVKRRKADGTLVGTVASKALSTGTFNAFVAVDLGALTNQELGLGEQLTFAISQPATTGIAVPLGHLQVDIQPHS